MATLTPVDFDPFGTPTPSPSPAASDGVAPPQSNVSVPEDMARAVPTGLARGVAGLAGMPGDLRQGAEWLGSEVIGWLAAKLGADPEEAQRDLREALAKAPRKFPTSGEIVKGIEHIKGSELYKPQTRPGRYTETVAELVPSTVGPGGPMRNLVNFALVPGMASELVGERTKGTTFEPWARAGTALAAGGFAALVNKPTSVGQTVAKALESASPAQLEAAERLFADAHAAGVPITRPEAIQYVTNGATRLADLQRVVEAQGGMKEFFAGRAQGNDAAARRLFDTVSPQPAPPSSVGPAVGEAAQQTLAEARTAIEKASDPYYRAAHGMQLDPFTFERLKNDPVFAEGVRRVRDDPWIGPTIKNLPDDSVAVVDQVRKLLDETGRHLRDPINSGRNNQAAAIVEGGRDRVVKAADFSTGSHPYEGPGTYETARSIEDEARRRFLEPLLQGPLGKLAERDMTTQRAIETLFPRNPLPNSAEEISAAVSALAKRNPAAAVQLVRTHMESVFNEAARALEAGPNQWGGAGFAAALRGNPQQAANLEAAVKALPNGADTWRGIDRFLQFLQAQGQRQSIGSSTPFDTALRRELQKGSELGDAVMLAPGIGIRLPTQIKDAIEGWHLGRRTQELARLFTDPGLGLGFRRLADQPPGSRQAFVTLLRLLPVAHQAFKSSEQVQNPTDDEGH
jgi:hypothetical protein